MKIEIIDDGNYPYALIDEVFTASELYKILKDTFSYETGDYFLHSSNTNWELYQEKAWEIHDKVFNELFKLTENPNNKYLKLENRTSFFRIQLKKLAPGFERNRIHTDSDWKQLVVVIYVSEEGEGTKLYKENDETTHYKTIPFKQNTAYAHIPCEQSWHDFEHPAIYKSDRTSLMFLLADTRYYK